MNTCTVLDLLSLFWRVREGLVASFPGPRPASRRLQWEAGRGPGNEAKGLA